MSPTKCASHHFGPWLIEPEWFRNATASVKAGLLVPEPQAAEPAGDKPAATRSGYSLTGGTAVVPIEGAMMKIRSKFGGTSTVDVRSALRGALADERVESILLLIDSPGGTVAGTDALAQEVAAANKVKPVHAHIEDMGASAAYYVASQARRITASPTSLVGSLGTRMEVIDSSKYFEDKGIVVHDISTGEFKGAGTEGTKITDNQLAYFQGIVNEGSRHFKTAVMRGRGFTQEQTDALFDGRVHDADQAKTIGLIDEVSTLDAAMAALQTETQRMNAENFSTYAAEHPEAVAVFIEQGKKIATTDTQNAEVARFKGLRAACPNRPELAADLFEAGKDANDAAAIVAALDKEAAQRKAEAEANAKALAEKDKEIARLTFAASGQGAVGATAGEVAVGNPNDPKTVAAAEWKANKDGCQQAFSSEANYLAIRAAELSGQHRNLNK